MDLIPGHKIKIDNTGAFSGAVKQPQRILLYLEEEELKQPKAELSSKVLPISEVESFPQLERLFPILKKSGLDILCVWGPVEEVIKVIEPMEWTHLVVLHCRKALTEMLERRWAPDVQLDGHMFRAMGGEQKTVKDLVQKINSPRVSVIYAPQDKEFLWAASLAFVNAQEAGEDPARPYSNIALPCLEVPMQLSPKERNDLLLSGVSTWKKPAGDNVVLERLVSTYTKSLSGAMDPSYRDVNTIQTLSYLRFFFRQDLLRSFPRHKLAKDDFPYPGDVLTPKALKVWFLSKYRQLQEKGLVQDPEGGFSKTLMVKVDPDNPGSVKVHMEPHIMGQLYQTDIVLGFKI